MDSYEIRYIGNPLHIEEINGENYITFETVDKLEPDELIEYKDTNGKTRRFSITKLEAKRENGFIIYSVYAESLIYRLNDVIVTNKVPLGSRSGADLMRDVLVGSGFELGYSDMKDKQWIAGIDKDYFTGKTVRESIAAIIEVFGGEIEERYEGNKKYLDYKKSIGEDKGLTLSYGDNVANIKKTVDYSEVYTGIFPLGAVVEEGNTGRKHRLTILGANIKERMIIDWEATKKYGIKTENGMIPRIKKVYYDNIDDVYDLYKKAEASLSVLSKPSVSYEVSGYDLSELIDEQGPVNLGDSVRIVDEELKIDEKQRVMRIERSLKTGEPNTIYFGNREREDFMNQYLTFAERFQKIEDRAINRFIDEGIKEGGNY